MHAYRLALNFYSKKKLGFTGLYIILIKRLIFYADMLTIIINDKTSKASVSRYYFDRYWPNHKEMEK